MIFQRNLNDINDYKSKQRWREELFARITSLIYEYIHISLCFYSTLFLPITQHCALKNSPQTIAIYCPSFWMRSLITHACSSGQNTKECTLSWLYLFQLYVNGRNYNCVGENLIHLISSSQQKKIGNRKEWNFFMSVFYVVTKASKNLILNELRCIFCNSHSFWLPPSTSLLLISKDAKLSASS